MAANVVVVVTSDTKKWYKCRKIYIMREKREEKRKKKKSESNENIVFSMVSCLDWELEIGKARSADKVSIRLSIQRIWLFEYIFPLNSLPVVIPPILFFFSFLHKS